MVTDRCATTCLICVLCYFYSNWLFLWQVLIALDIGSHWVQMYMSLLHGETSHKVTDLSANPIMRFYYSKVCDVHRTSCWRFLLHFFQPVLFSFCAGNELFFAALYIIYFTAGPIGITQRLASLLVICFSLLSETVRVWAWHLVYSCWGDGADLFPQATGVRDPVGGGL